MRPLDVRLLRREYVRVAMIQLPAGTVHLIGKVRGTLQTAISRQKRKENGGNVTK